PGRAALLHRGGFPAGRAGAGRGVEHGSALPLRLVHAGHLARPGNPARAGQTGLALGRGRLRGLRWPGRPRPDGSDVDAGTARTDAQAAFRQELRSFTKAHGTSQAVRALLDDPAGYDPAVWELMAKQLGLPGLIIDEEHGGSEAGAAEAVIALEGLGAPLPPPPFPSPPPRPVAGPGPGPAAQRRPPPRPPPPPRAAP